MQGKGGTTKKTIAKKEKIQCKGRSKAGAGKKGQNGYSPDQENTGPGWILQHAKRRGQPQVLGRRIWVLTTGRKRKETATSKGCGQKVLQGKTRRS